MNLAGSIIRFKCILSHDVNVGRVIDVVDNIFHVRIIRDEEETDQYRWIPSTAIKEIIDDTKTDKAAT